MESNVILAVHAFDTSPLTYIKLWVSGTEVWPDSTKETKPITRNAFGQPTWHLPSSLTGNLNLATTSEGVDVGNNQQGERQQQNLQR